MTLADADSIEDVSGTLPIDNNHFDILKEILIKNHEELNSRLDQIEAEYKSKIPEVKKQSVNNIKHLFCGIIYGSLLTGLSLLSIGFTFWSILFVAQKH